MEFGKVKKGSRFSFYEGSKPEYIKVSATEARFAQYTDTAKQMDIKSGIKLDATFPVVVIKNR